MPSPLEQIDAIAASLQTLRATVAGSTTTPPAPPVVVQPPPVQMPPPAPPVDTSNATRLTRGFTTRLRTFADVQKDVPRLFVFNSGPSSSGSGDIAGVEYQSDVTPRHMWFSLTPGGAPIPFSSSDAMAPYKNFFIDPYSAPGYPTLPPNTDIFVTLVSVADGRVSIDLR
jgi:hypothetical protein